MARRPINRGKTREEQLAYMRGFNRGAARTYEHAHKVIEAARGWREKVVNSLDGARCDQCQFWTRGGHGCAWGYCGQDYTASPELGMAWAEREIGQPQAKMVSYENFACINFLRPHPPLVQD